VIRQKLAASMTMLALVAAGVLAGASPAAAAQPRCNTGSTYINASGAAYEMPAVMNGTTYGSFSCYLSYKIEKNSGVYQVQQALIYCYDLNIALDSIYGNETVNAVKTVQRRLGIGADGIYGDQTRWRMAVPTHLIPIDPQCKVPVR
jgi:peptidoglycan hydrolase-like protein with peptidoglycan-binding domain